MRGEDVTVKIVDGAVVSVAVDATLAGSQHRYAPDRNPARVYLMSLAVGSRRTMRGALETISQLVSNGRADALTLPWHELRYQYTSAIRSDLSRRYSPATTNKMLSAMKGVLKECWRLNYISGEQYQRARDVSAVRGSTLPRGRALSSGELRSLFEACSLDEKPVRGTRDAALVAVLYAAGLRRAEAVGLDVADFDPETSRLTVRGKGGKERYTYAAGGAAQAMADWLWYRDTDTHDSAALFHPVLKSGRIVRERRMHEQSVYDILRRRAHEIASHRSFSPHDLRRTFVSDIIDARGDLSVAQQLAGHSSPATTARYDRRGEKAKQEAASSLHVPYRRTRRPGGDPTGDER